MIAAQESSLADWAALVILMVTTAGVLGWMFRHFGRQEAKRDREREAREAKQTVEHERHMAELREQKRLRELEDLRAALLRGRDTACQFCGIENGALTAQRVCVDVEECFSRSGVPAERDPPKRG